MEANETILDIRNLAIHFRTSRGVGKAVDDVSFRISRGRTLALVGESGCGKSMTALGVMQLIPAPAGFQAGGAIHLNGREISTLPEVDKRKVRGDEAAMIFQEPMTSLNPVFTVGNQIVEAIRLHQKLDKPAAREKAIRMLDEVGIPEPAQRYGEYPHQLSGGMRQRVMIAMALACEPDLLIADEPTTALDVTIQSQILDLIKKLQAERGMAVLLITHDLGVVRENADEICVMYAGKIVEHADRDTLFRNPKHPYTVKLFESIPQRQKRGRALATIRGRVPNATDYPPGCRFHDRCPEVMEGCREILPKDLEVGPDHTAACHLFDDHFSGGKLSQTEPEAHPPETAPSEADPEASPLVAVKGLKVHFPIKKGVFKRTVGHVKAVDGVDLEIPEGRTLALVGESGCGKTTAGKSLLQLIRPTAGSVRFNGTELTVLSRGELRPLRRNFQIIFQDPFSSLNPRMMVGEIIAEGMAVHRIGANREEREARVREVMETVGLDPDMIHRYPHEFSGGQRQRIGIARALAVQAKLIVCDEATSALDVSVQAQILNLLERLQREFCLTYLFITHNLGVVEYLADEVAVMYLGKVVERGTAEEIFDDPKHPYTRALLSAVPQIDPDTGIEKIKLEGDVPSPVNPPPGCPFHPRCPEAKPECSRMIPEWVGFTDTHRTTCLLYGAGDSPEHPET